MSQDQSGMACLTCLYCGYTWEQMIYSQYMADHLRCLTCNDPDIRFDPKKEITKDIFGYDWKQRAMSRAKG